MQLFIIGGFVVGLLLGSFLNVCISRLPKGESVVRPGSHCMACGHAVRWYDNVPLLSWLVLRGRCRDCGVGISWRYPAVELAIGFVFMYLAMSFWYAWVANSPEIARSFDLGMTFTIEQVGLSVLWFLLIGLMVMDWQTQRLPDAFTLTGVAIGFFLVCAEAIFLAPGQGDVVLDTNRQLRLSSPGSFAAQGNVFLTGPEALVFGRVAAVLGAALILLIVRWVYRAARKRDGLGLGDVKMLAMIAAFLGFGQSVLALLVGAVAASIYGIFLMAKGRAGGTTRLPFGSFLAVGGLFAALFGPGLVGWYVGLLR